MNGAAVQGIYKSTIHLSLNEAIITVGAGVGRGKHHILIDAPVDFYSLDIRVGSKAEIKDQAIQIGSLILDVKEDSMNFFYPYTKTYRIDIQSFETIKNLKSMIKEIHHHNVFSYRKDDPWLKYQFEKIDIFLNSPGLPSALSILGLGMGLTPLGDDILTGFILGLNSVGKSLPWLPQLIIDAQKKTNKLSAQNLFDTYERYYPDIFIDMLEGIFIEHDVEKAKTILNLGATSGAGILTGFIYGLM
jgi:hypothetical protein